MHGVTCRQVLQPGRLVNLVWCWWPLPPFDVTAGGGVVWCGFQAFSEACVLWVVVVVARAALAGVAALPAAFVLHEVLSFSLLLGLWVTPAAMAALVR